MQAYIADIVHLSANNWKDTVSTSIYFAGCDFGCPSCSVPHMLHQKPDFVRELKDVKKEIKDNSHFCSAVVFTGGEPCFQREALLNLAQFSKGISLKVGIETNGSKPEVLRSLFSMDLVDFIAFDIKAPLEKDLLARAAKCGTFFKTTDSVIDDLKKSLIILQAYQVRNPKVEIEFRTTIIPSIVFKKEHILAIAELVQGFDCTLRLQQFRPQTALDKKLRSINPPTREFLETLRDAVQKQYPNLRVVI
jgi:pyruvate formate lyase activating enzyme